jgi:hypothetical protein
MITEIEIETYALQIAEPAFGKISDATLAPLIGHLDPADFEAVLERAAEIAHQRGDAALAEADALENLHRLARAAGMPDGGKPIPWLQERGLIEEVDGGWCFKAAGPDIVM